LKTISEEIYNSIFNINVKGLLFTVQKASADAGWWLHHPECILYGQQGLVVEQCDSLKQRKPSNFVDHQRSDDNGVNPNQDYHPHSQIG
jgi:hypothetical protein